MKNIRNFSIIAHIDHGKSTLADRLLELTGTIEKRKMKEQVLDSMDLERERGITIKMQPVTMKYTASDGTPYILNLIDTPGHIDFSYEVSRSLEAVEGVILLVDASQGIQAQTLTVLEMARELGLVIIPVINKIDLPTARPEEVREEIREVIGSVTDDILLVSGKTGAGADELLAAVVRRIPPPAVSAPVGRRALVFDFEYSSHKGVVVYVRLLDGLFRRGDHLIFAGSKEKFTVLDLGIFAPARRSTETLEAGEIGFLVTGLKNAAEARVGDTIIDPAEPLPVVPGFRPVSPVVWASIYPESQDDFTLLKQALERLRLSDSAISFEEESQGALGRGFRTGFLGMLHLEIVTERLKREFNLSLIIATPTISYHLVDGRTGKEDIIYTPHLFPEDLKNKQVIEQWVEAKIIAPAAYLSPIMQLFYDHEAEIIDTENFGDQRTTLVVMMPLRELMRNFFDEIKSATSGFASLSYRLADRRPADVVRLDILIAEEPVPAFTKIIARRRVDKEAEEAVNRLKELLPRQLFVVKIQARALGRIIASRSLPAMRKDVTGHLYGGDITRKMKLLSKQKKGKKKMKSQGKVNVPQEVFLKMIRNDKK
ncbi:MAG: translation elongation factor 4 [Candidatus Paceibacterota bacterium]